MKKLLGALTLATFLCVSGAAYAHAVTQDAPKEDTAKDKKKDAKMKKEKKSKKEKKEGDEKKADDKKPS